MIKNVLDYLEQSAAKSPDKTAVADEHNAFTYQELLDNAQRVGAVLQKETPVRTAVPVYMEKSCNALAAFMGAAKAGCFLLPVRPGTACRTYPDDSCNTGCRNYDYR